MFARHVLAVVLSTVVLQQAGAQEACTTEQAILSGHRVALVERLGAADAQLFLAELVKIAGDPPAAIKPSAFLVFRNDDGSLAGQFFDEKGCAAFGTGMSESFYGILRSKIGGRA